MERRKFITTTAAVTGALAAGAGNVMAKSRQSDNEIYEFRVYQLAWGTSMLDEYLSKALIPALNRLGIKNVGVFTEIGKSEPVKIYVLIPHKSFEEYGKVMRELTKDQTFVAARQSYDQVAPEQKVYDRFESSLLLAFDGLPQMVVPKNSSRIFELRIYEGYSEDAVRRKVKMFNEGEFDIFYRTKLNPVFFGEMMIGKQMPCLAYMITFKDMAERDKNWEAFGKDPEWQKISKDPQYANTVSRIYKTFLEPVSYSQI
jgi:hypothetical protein